MKNISKKNVTDRFKDVFGFLPEVTAKSPGRINVIGEHTDYNEGFVLPAAIDKYTFASVSPRKDDEINLYAELFKEKLSFRLSEIKPLPNSSWANYILGVVHHIENKGYRFGTGFDMYVDGDVPFGAGVSSSASLECAVAVAINKIYSLGLQDWEIAKIAQSAEHTFAGVKCGIMDQFASIFSKENKVAKLDCRSLDFEYFPLELGDYTLLLLNTNVKHSLASSAYNDRRASCEKSVEIVKKHHPEVNALRDVSEEMLDIITKDAYPELYKKASFVCRENLRVENTCKALAQGDLKTVGQLIYQSHEGLSRDYEVSCEELDFLVNEVRQFPEVLGARMMGGGFGGCTINLVKKDFISDLVDKIKPKYEAKFNLELTNIEVVPSGGGTVI